MFCRNGPCLIRTEQVCMISVSEHRTYCLPSFTGTSFGIHKHFIKCFYYLKLKLLILFFYFFIRDGPRVIELINYWFILNSLDAKNASMHCPTKNIVIICTIRILLEKTFQVLQAYLVILTNNYNHLLFLYILLIQFSKYLNIFWASFRTCWNRNYVGAKMWVWEQEQ